VKIQPDTIRTNATAVIHSSRESGPDGRKGLARRDWSIRCLADTRREQTRAMIQGKATIAVNTGTEEAVSHLPKLISSPNSRTNWIPIGFADVAIIHNADDTARLAIVQTIN
jgi:hypothetical protein